MKNALALTALLLISSSFPQATTSLVAATPPYVSDDPCIMQKKTTVTLTSSNTASTQLVGLATFNPALNTIYICSVAIKPNAATAFSLVEGTGANCATSQIAVMGNLTPANGMPFSGLGDGIALAPGGTLWSTAVPGDEICFTQSIAESVSITLGYVQTPL